MILCQRLQHLPPHGGPREYGVGWPDESGGYTVVADGAVIGKIVWYLGALLLELFGGG